jgi:hypothetical protein
MAAGAKYSPELLENMRQGSVGEGKIGSLLESWLAGRRTALGISGQRQRFEGGFPPGAHAALRWHAARNRAAFLSHRKRRQWRRALRRAGSAESRWRGVWRNSRPKPPAIARLRAKARSGMVLAFAGRLRSARRFSRPRKLFWSRFARNSFACGPHSAQNARRCLADRDEAQSRA